MGKPGGGTLFLMAVFWLLVVICPVLRPLLRLLSLLGPAAGSAPWQRALLAASKLAGHYYALEVFVVCVPLLDLTLAVMLQDMTNGMPEVRHTFLTWGFGNALRSAPDGRRSVGATYGVNGQGKGKSSG